MDFGLSLLARLIHFEDPWLPFLYNRFSKDHSTTQGHTRKFSSKSLKSSACSKSFCQFSYYKNPLCTYETTINKNHDFEREQGGVCERGLEVGKGRREIM